MLIIMSLTMIMSLAIVEVNYVSVSHNQKLGWEDRKKNLFDILFFCESAARGRGGDTLDVISP